jgi:hypothetical protein
MIRATVENIEKGGMRRARKQWLVESAPQGEAIVGVALGWQGLFGDGKAKDAAAKTRPFKSRTREVKF